LRAIQFSIEDYEINKGDVFQYRVEYGGKAVKAKRPPWKGGTVWKKDKNKNPWLGVACETMGASVWVPCKDHNLDEADSVSVSVICKNTVTGVSNGRLTGVDTLENDKLKFNWATSYPINNYNITYYIGDFVEIKDTLNAIRGLVNVSHYVLRDNEQKATEHFQQVHDIFHFYEKTFGPYSWVKDGFKLVEAPYAGMEHQTAIAYGSGYKNRAIVHSDYIILHEAAHEWWGNSVSATDFAHIWIHEGMATYSEALYAEHVGGEDSYFNKIRYDKIFIQNKRSVVGPEDLMYFNFKESDCYMKGSVVMATLRSVLESDSLFFEIIKTFYAENEKQLVNTTDFMDLVNSITGQNFNWFFNQYLYDRHVPTLEQFVSFDGFIYHRWSNCNPDFKMELDVEINNVKYHIKPTTVLSRTEIHKTGIEHNYSFDNYAKYYRWNKENHELEKEYEDAASETLDH
jgi:aminopeptidase N